MNSSFYAERLITTLFVLVLMNVLLTTTVCAGGTNRMEYMYDVKGAAEIKPQVYKMDTSTRLMLFPVPFDNAVGTNNYRNALTIISFPNGKLDMKHYFKRAVDNIDASGRYLPVINDHLVGFGQMRRFLLFDFKKKKVQKYRIAFSIESSMLNIAVADAGKRQFLFETETFTSRSSANFDRAYHLLLLDLSGDEVKEIKSVRMLKSSSWVVAYDRIFEWASGQKIMRVFDLNLEPSQHPMADIILDNRHKTSCSFLIPHPELPFALLNAGGQEGVSYISWGEKRDKTLKRFMEDGDQLLFSPDGKWLTFQWGSFTDRITYIMPVSEKYPNFLGTPILLHNEYFEKENCAWTNNPMSFVGARRLNLFRWELTKEAQKEMMGDDYDKYETFHDWIVEKYLEKLTKEKKQGLK